MNGFGVFAQNSCIVVFITATEKCSLKKKSALDPRNSL